MSLLGWAVVSELVLSVIFLTLLFAYKWRQRRRQHRDIEQLLVDIEARQMLRSQELSQCLQEHFGLDSESSGELSGQLIQAEKQFLQAFIAQQLRQVPISCFYEDLCEVLDAYYRGLASAGKPVATSSVPMKGSDEQVAELESLLPIKELPDWGDVFD